MPDNNNKNLDSRTQIVLALIGLFGSVGVALITNWDKFSPPKPSISVIPSPVVKEPIVLPSISGQISSPVSSTDNPLQALPTLDLQNKRASIINAGKVYSTINTGNCLIWPSADIKIKADEKIWKLYGYYPKAGDQGIIVGTSHHCNTNVSVVILKVGENYVPIGSDGIKILPDS